MGSPKALLTLDGTTFIERIVEALRAGGCNQIVVVTGPHADRDAFLIGERARSLGATVEVNPDRDSQQIDSLRIALQSVPATVDALVMSPVDAPLVTAALVARLIGAIRQGAPVAVPAFEGRRGHPIAFSGSVADELREPDLPRGARTVIERHREALVEIEAESADVLLDVDTPGEYERLLEGRR